MIVSDCCGALIKVERRPEHPHVYDDNYELWIPMMICTECGRILGLDSAKNHGMKPKE
jgi:hypothetical protein